MIGTVGTPWRRKLNCEEFRKARLNGVGRGSSLLLKFHYIATLRSVKIFVGFPENDSPTGKYLS